MTGVESRYFLRTNGHPPERIVPANLSRKNRKPAHRTYPSRKDRIEQKTTSPLFTPAGLNFCVPQPIMFVCLTVPGDSPSTHSHAQRRPNRCSYSAVLTLRECLSRKQILSGARPGRRRSTETAPDPSLARLTTEISNLSSALIVKLIVDWPRCKPMLRRLDHRSDCQISRDEVIKCHRAFFPLALPGSK
jgi:hypothetical protein